MALAHIFRFPNPVNEVAARLVAGGVVVLCAAYLMFGAPWLLVVLTAGFVLRVASGPKLSPLAIVVTRVIVPRLPIAARMVAGPPKRFAQAIGATLSLGACAALFAFDAAGIAFVLVAAITVAATLESVFAFCLGCKMFALLMRVGVIPQSVCVECNDISTRLAATDGERA